MGDWVICFWLLVKVLLSFTDEGIMCWILIMHKIPPNFSNQDYSQCLIRSF